MALLYNGYAQARGFQAINLSDSTPEKIREQGLRSMQNQKEAIAWNGQQADRVANQLRQNHSAEAKNRESNFRLRTDFNRMYAKAEWGKIQSQINASEARSKQQTQLMDEVLKLTKTGSQIIGERVQKKQDALKVLWKDHANKYGIDPNIVKEINGLKKGLWNSSMKTTAQYRKLKEQGASDDIIRELHGLDGYLQISIAESDAVRKVRELPSLIEQLGNERLQVGDTTTTFNTAFESGDPVKLGEALRQIELLIDEKRGGSIDYKVLESSGAWKMKDTIFASIYRNQQVVSKRKAKEANAQRLGAFWDNAKIQPKIDEETGLQIGTVSIGEAYLNLIDHQGGDKIARDQVNAMLIHRLESGLATEEYGKILDHEFTPRGWPEGKITTIREHWKGDAKKIEKALFSNASHAQKVADLSQAAYKTKKATFLGETFEFLYGGEEQPTADQLIERHKVAVKNGFSESAQLIQKEIALDGAGGINSKTSLLRLQAKIKRGEFIGVDYLKSLNLPPQLEVQASQMITTHNREMPTQGETGTDKILTEWINRKLEALLPSKSVFQKSHTALWAKREARSIGLRYYKSYIRKNGYDQHDDALNYATDMLTKEIEQKNTFEVDLNPRTKHRDFVGGRSDPNRTVLRLNTTEKVSDIRRDRSALDSLEILPAQELLEKSQAISLNGSGFDIPEALIIENQTGVSALEQEMRQIAFHNKLATEAGTPLIPEYPKEYINAYKKARSRVKPDQQYKLSLNSTAAINSAHTDGPLPYIKPMIDNSRELLQKRIQPVGGYNNINTGEGDKHSKKVKDFNFHLTNATLRQVVQLKLEQAGMYRLTGEQIEKYAEAAGLSMESSFSRPNQDKLFEIIFRAEGEKPWLESITEPGDQAYLQESYKSLTEPFSPRSIAFVRPELHGVLAEVQNV